MLDDKNIILQRDPSGALEAVASLPEQARFEPEIIGETTVKPFHNIVMAGMGGSALAADMIKTMTKHTLSVPLEVVKGYDLPAYADEHTLVITISHSGNTEETLSCYDQAQQKSCVIAAMATGGQLLERAARDEVLHAVVPNGAQPRMSTVYHLRVLLLILQRFALIDSSLYQDVANSAEWLKQKIAEWLPDNPTEHNYAKQLAEQSVGKTAVFYGGEVTAPIAYKWKISWNESAKNTAFWNQYPEFNHNEFMGWTSHPVEKPFMVIDIRSELERPRITERMELSDRMLSGKRPKALPVQLIGDSIVQQFLWALALADLASIYLAILNNVDPTPVAMIETFKKELS